MRAFFAIVAGFVFTLGVFVSGLAVATWFLAAEPVRQAEVSPDVTDLWTKEPRTVKMPVVGLERLPARPIETVPRGARAADAASQDVAETVAAAAPLDATVTGAIAPDADGQWPAGRLSAVHIEWCASRYRSYDPSANSYRPYSGGTRPCISPYLEMASVEGEAGSGAAARAVNAFAGEIADAAESVAAPELGYASAEQGMDFVVTSDHIARCFSRYRSYRPQDNTYQPYGGGPRRQCE